MLTQDQVNTARVTNELATEAEREHYREKLAIARQCLDLAIELGEDDWECKLWEEITWYELALGEIPF